MSSPPTATSAQPRTIDWVGEEGLQAAREEIETPSTVAGHRETTRSQLARWLMGLLTITVLSLILLAGLQLADVIGMRGTSIGDLAQIVLTPVVTLTGTALGFYFGAQGLSGGEPSTGGMPARRDPGILRKAFHQLW
jgi:hypothetical protein